MSGNEREGLIGDLVVFLANIGAQRPSDHPWAVEARRLADRVKNDLTFPQAQEPIPHESEWREPSGPPADDCPNRRAVFVWSDDTGQWEIEQWLYEAQEPVAECVGTTRERGEDMLVARPINGFRIPQPIGTKLYASPVASAPQRSTATGIPIAGWDLASLTEYRKQAEVLIQELEAEVERQRASAPEEEREAYTMAEIYAALSDGSVFDAIMRSLRATSTEEQER